MSLLQKWFVLVFFGVILCDVKIVGAEGREPVVFLHGLCSSSDTWNHTKETLQNNGWIFGGALQDPLDQAELSRYPTNADFYLVNFADQSIIRGIQGWAMELYLYLSRINQFRTQHGLPSTKFTLVGHSAGGLAATYYLKHQLYPGNVSHLITYGTPHLGTPATKFRKLIDYVLRFIPVYYVSESPCLNPVLVEESQGVTQMIPNSAFLRDLNAQSFPTDVIYTSLIGDYRSYPECIDNDCIVSISSQDIRNVPNPPRADLVAVRTFVNRTHLDETSDADSILWALNRTMAVPGAPSGLTVIPGSSTASLMWDASVSGSVSTYVIEAGTSSGLTDIISFETGSTETRFFAPRVDPGTYFVRVRGKNPAGTGPASNEVSFSIGNILPSQLVGTWRTLDPLVLVLGGITKVTIRAQGNNFFVNMWSTCGGGFVFLNECPEGEVPAVVGGPVGPLSALWNFPGIVQTATFSLTASGYLRVSAHVHVTDGSGPDFDVNAMLMKISN